VLGLRVPRRWVECSGRQSVGSVEVLRGVVGDGEVFSVERDGRRPAAKTSRVSVYRRLEANGVRLSPGGREGSARSLATERNAPSQAARGIGWGMGHGRSLWPGGRSGQEAVRSGALARSDGLPAILGRVGCPGSGGAGARAAKAWRWERPSGSVLEPEELADRLAHDGRLGPSLLECAHTERFGFILVEPHRLLDASGCDPLAALLIVPALGAHAGRLYTFRSDGFTPLHKYGIVDSC